MSKVATKLLAPPPHKSVCFIITGRKHANKIRASVAESSVALPPER